MTPAIPHRAKSFVHREAKTTVGSAIVPYLSVEPEPADTLRAPFKPLLIAIWFTGFAFILGRYFAEWRRVAMLARTASPFPRRATLSAFGPKSLVPVVAMQ